MQEYLTQVTQIKHLTLDIIELSVQLVVPTELSYQAGQFVEFKIGNDHRAYSFAAPPVVGSKVFTFCIKLEPDGVGSNYIRTLEVGSEVVLQAPFGTFVIQDLQQPAFFVTTGVGVAPFAAMIPDMLSRGAKVPVYLLFGVRSEENVFYFERFSRLARQFDNFQFVPMLSRPQSHWPGQTGQVTTYLQVGYPDFKDFMFYLCGSTAMVADTRQLLLKAGHDVKKIQQEIFF